MRLLSITSSQLDEDGVYKGFLIPAPTTENPEARARVSEDLTNWPGDIEIDPCLGLVVFEHDLKLRGSLKAHPGTSVRVHGDAMIGGGVQLMNGGIEIKGGSLSVAHGVEADWSIVVDGKMSIGGSITCHQDVSAGDTIFVGESAKVGGFLLSRGEIDAGGRLEAGADIRAVGDLKSRGEIVCGGSASGNRIRSIGDLVVGGSIVSRSDIFVKGLLQAQHLVVSGGWIKAQDGLEVGAGLSAIGSIITERGGVNCGGEIATTDRLVSRQDIEAGGRVWAATTIFCMGDVMAGGSVSAEEIQVSRRVFAGFCRGRTPTLEEQEIRGRIVNGMIGTGAHVDQEPAKWRWIMMDLHNFVEEHKLLDSKPELKIGSPKFLWSGLVPQMERSEEVLPAGAEADLRDEAGLDFGDSLGEEDYAFAASRGPASFPGS